MSARTFDDAAAISFRRDLREWLSATALPSLQVVEISHGSEAHVQRGRQWDRLLFESGYAGLSWPPEHSGKGPGVVEEGIFYEECARAGAPDGFSRFTQHMLGSLLIEFGTAAQQQKFLAPMLDGSQIWCQGSSEPDAGSDLAATSTAAERCGDEYLIRGRKIWTSGAQVASRCWLLAKTDKAGRRHHNLSLLLLDMDQPGVSVSPIRQITGASGFSEVAFDGARAPVGDRIGAENEGWAVIRWTLARERGVYQSMRRYLEISGYLRQARQCQADVGDSRREVAERLKARLELVWWHVVRCVEETALGRDSRGAESVLKLYWSELWQEIAHFGYDLGCDEHRDYWREVYLYSRSPTIWAGTSEIQRNIISERVLGMPRLAAG
jgi:alkylation response protein AidB-like acyl-CoA dehydrogenase